MTKICVTCDRFPVTLYTRFCIHNCAGSRPPSICSTSALSCVNTGGLELSIPAVMGHRTIICTRYDGWAHTDHSRSVDCEHFQQLLSGVSCQNHNFPSSFLYVQGSKLATISCIYAA